jgi:hypothetical protein
MYRQDAETRKKMSTALILVLRLLLLILTSVAHGDVNNVLEVPLIEVAQGERAHSFWLSARRSCAKSNDLIVPSHVMEPGHVRRVSTKEHHREGCGVS